MKFTSPLILVAMSCALFGCASPGQSYARQHPELPKQHLQILVTGKIPDGDAVSGMTREQVQLAMGMDPTQFRKIDGQDAWVYVREKLSATAFTPTTGEGERSDNRNRDSQVLSNKHLPDAQSETKTTIFFQGNRAIRAEVVTGGL